LRRYCDGLERELHRTQLYNTVAVYKPAGQATGQQTTAALSKATIYRGELSIAQQKNTV
jgi:hypothetical protein